MRILSIDVQPTKPHEKVIEPFDNTKLVAVNTCPKWGIIRYGYHKTLRNTGRSMALEAGSAAHDMFAAHRLYSFAEYGADFYGKEPDEIQDIAQRNGIRIFGNERYVQCISEVQPREDFRTRCQQFVLTALYNSEFYDDPNDKRRTTTNLEELGMVYMDRFDWKNELPVIGHDGTLGIEIPVDVMISMLIAHKDGMHEEFKFRFYGKADGIHWTNRKMERARIHENKTASRLGDSWDHQWNTNHQPTGYMIALSAMWQMEINESLMLGTALPMPANFSVTGLSRIVARRSQEQFIAWARWAYHTINDQFMKHYDDPLNAPQHTDQCNRYFSTCMFMSLCSSSMEEQEVDFEDMAEEKWSPLDELERKQNSE